MSDWPEHVQELSRKTADQLQVWADRFDRGVISHSAFLAVVSALYDATSGLIEKDLSDALAEVHKDLRATAKP